MFSRWQRHIVSESGDVMPDAEVEVTIAGEATLADLCSNADGTTGQSNPFNADGGGYAFFYVAGGTYDIYVNGVKIWENVQLGTMQEHDLSDGYARQVDSVSDLRSGSFPASLKRIWLAGYYGVGTAGGGPLYRKGDGYTEADENGILWVDADGVGWEAGPGFVLAEDATLRVPSRFDTLQEAIDETSHYQVTQGVTIDLLIESGHQPESGVEVEDGDYRHYKVSAEDSEVAVSSNYSGHFIRALNAWAPALNCLVNANHLGDDGYSLINHSHGFVHQDCGVIYAGNRGLYVGDGCSCYARRCVFDRAWSRGFWFTRGARGDIEYGSFDYCNENLSVNTSNSVRRCSQVNAAGVSIQNSFNTGVNASRASLINLAEATIRFSGNEGVRSERGSIISLPGAEVSDSESHGCRTFNGGIIEATDSVCKDNGGSDFHASNGIIFSAGATVTGDNPARRIYTSTARDVIYSIGNTLNGVWLNAETGEFQIYLNESVDLTSNERQEFQYPNGFELSTRDLINGASVSFYGLPGDSDRGAIQNSMIIARKGDFIFSCDGSGNDSDRGAKLFATGRTDDTSQFLDAMVAAGLTW